MSEPTGPGGLPPAHLEKGLRGSMSAAAMLECIVLLLALPVASNQDVGTVGTIAILTLSAAHLALCAYVRRSWFLPAVITAQVLVLACWFFSTAVGVVGVIFGLAWAMLIWFRNEFRRRWAAGTLPMQQPIPSESGE